MRRRAGKAAVVVLALVAALPTMGGCSPYLLRGIHEIDYGNGANRDIARGQRTHAQR
jgi:hypothetical protein